MKLSVFTLIAALPIITVNSVFANDNAIVASKSYVDTRDNAKQDKITSKTTGNVVTYNGTDANNQTTFDERGIYDGTNTYTNADANKLTTAAPLHNFANTFEGLTIPNHKFECANPGECSLWTFGSGTKTFISEGTFNPLTEAPVSCKAYGEKTVVGQSECCSGFINSEAKCKRTLDGGMSCSCGCASDTDCPSETPTCDTSTHRCL